MKSEIKHIRYFYAICYFLISLGVCLTPFNHTKLGDSIPYFFSSLFYSENAISTYVFTLFCILFFAYKLAIHEIKDYKPILCFFFIFLLINIIIQIHGLLISPFFNMNTDYSVLTGANSMVFNIIKKLAPQKNDFFIFCIASTLKQLYSCSSYFVSTYFFIYSFFLFYKKTGYDYLHQLWICAAITIGLILFYEIIEYSHILGSEDAKHLIKNIFNFIYNTKSSNGWWPPELLDRIRSLFPEPSYFAYWGSVMVIFLIYGIYYENKIISGLEFLLLSFCIFCTDSRTGTMLLLGSISVFIFLNLFFNFKANLISTTIIAILVIISFIGSVLFLNNSIGFTWENEYSQPTQVKNIEQKNENKKYDESETIKNDSSAISNYIDSTVLSLLDENARSNNARYGLISAQINIFKHHPILGVGKDFIGYHEINAFPPNTENNKEIKTWQTNQKEAGPFINKLPKLNEYTYTLASVGILGFLVYTLPFCFISFLLVVSFLKNKNNCTHHRAIIISMCASIIAFGMSNGFLENYIYVIVFAIAFLELKTKINRKPSIS